MTDPQAIPAWRSAGRSAGVAPITDDDTEYGYDPEDESVDGASDAELDESALDATGDRMAEQGPRDRSPRDDEDDQEEPEARPQLEAEAPEQTLDYWRERAQQNERRFKGAQAKIQQLTESQRQAPAPPPPPTPQTPQYSQEDLQFFADRQVAVQRLSDPMLSDEQRQQLARNIQAADTIYGQYKQQAQQQQAMQQWQQNVAPAVKEAAIQWHLNQVQRPQDQRLRTILEGQNSNEGMEVAVQSYLAGLRERRQQSRRQETREAAVEQRQVAPPRNVQGAPGGWRREYDRLAKTGSREDMAEALKVLRRAGQIPF